MDRSPFLPAFWERPVEYTESSWRWIGFDLIARITSPCFCIGESVWFASFLPSKQLHAFLCGARPRDRFFASWIWTRPRRVSTLPAFSANKVIVLRGFPDFPILLLNETHWRLLLTNIFFESAYPKKQSCGKYIIPKFNAQVLQRPFSNRRGYACSICTLRACTFRNLFGHGFRIRISRHHSIITTSGRADDAGTALAAIDGPPCIGTPAAVAVAVGVVVPTPMTGLVIAAGCDAAGAGACCWEVCSSHCLISSACYGPCCFLQFSASSSRHSFISRKRRVCHFPYRSPSRGVGTSEPWPSRRCKWRSKSLSNRACGFYGPDIILEPENDKMTKYRDVNGFSEFQKKIHKFYQWKSFSVLILQW